MANPEDTPANQTNADEDIDRALADLADLVKPIATEGKISIDAFFYLLLIWSSFHVYPLEPPQEAFPDGAKVIPFKEGWQIVDFGDSISTSPGEYYGSYCTGRLINTAIQMIELMAQRGITKIGFLGHDVARRAAWMECLDHNISIINYEPTDFDWEVRYRILEDRKKSDKRRQKHLQEKDARYEPE